MCITQGLELWGLEGFGELSSRGFIGFEDLEIGCVAVEGFGVKEVRIWSEGLFS